MYNITEKQDPERGRGIGNFLARRNERQEEEFAELTKKVVSKLIVGISEEGTVSLFHNKLSGEFQTAIFTGFFTSSELPHLRVTLWKDDTKPDEKSFDFQREFFEVVVDHRILIEANESRINQLGGRGIAVVQRWDMGLDDWEIVYRRDTDHEAGNTAIPRSIREKTKFLHEILETTFDTAAMEEHFGRPYSTGDTISSDCADDPNVNFTHRKYWVRDLEHTVLLPLLSIS